MKGRINPDFWAWAEKLQRDQEVERERRLREFEKIVEEARRELGQYEENEFGPECP